MKNKPLSVETLDQIREPQDVSRFDIDSFEIFSLLSMFDRYGIWKLNCASGLVEWSNDVFLIHEMKPRDGSVNLAEAIEAYHPEDARVVGQLVEECISSKKPFRFVLRIADRKGGYKLVKATGMHRVSKDGQEEVIGTFSEFALAIRSIATIE